MSEAITFSPITLTTTMMEMVRCDVCKALLLSGDTQAHADWHTLLRGVSYSASLQGLV